MKTGNTKFCEINCKKHHTGFPLGVGLKEQLQCPAGPLSIFSWGFRLEQGGSSELWVEIYFISVYANNLWGLHPKWRVFTSVMGSRKDCVDICFFFPLGIFVGGRSAYKIYYFLLKNSHAGDESASRTEVSGGILNLESFPFLYKKLII